MSEGRRFQFGRNWNRFVERSFSEERLQIAERRIADFCGPASVTGKTFLDIGCGSGLHSYAALRLGAARIHSFDFDEESVAATRKLHKKAGAPGNWVIERGDVLDGRYMTALGKWSFVYSWGVLHHTGDVWKALDSAQNAVADYGSLYVALYSADVQPEQEFWLDVKQRYNRAGTLAKQRMVGWYVWNYGMGRSVRQLPQLVKQIAHYRFSRGMSYFTDVRDWLGGWPMEFVHDQAVVDLLEAKHGFELVNASTGEACTEFLFTRSGVPRIRSVVKEFVAARRSSPNGSGST